MVFELFFQCFFSTMHLYNHDTVVATMTFTGVNPQYLPKMLHANPGTVLKSARPDDSKTLPTCSN